MAIYLKKKKQKKNRSIRKLKEAIPSGWNGYHD